jgi:transcription elongation factor GreA
VGDLEADIKEFRIAVTSPIARAMIGKQQGDEILVRAPGGDLSYEIIGIVYV